jgi:hypothetical protein
MKQPAMICFILLKGLKAKNIHTELGSVYGPETLARRTVKKWQRLYQQGGTDLSDDPRSGRPMANDLGEAIGSILAEGPFSSCNVFYRDFRIGKATCLRIPHHKPGLKTFHLGQVPRVPPANRKSERVSYAKCLLTALT